MSGSWGLPGSPTCVTRGGLSSCDRTPPTETMKWQVKKRILSGDEDDDENRVNSVTAP
jgi:hypothetical protein